MAALTDAINQCCSNNSARHSSTATLNQLDVELSDKDAIVLNQNVPNPFAEQTTITYNVPATVEKAQIIFYNSEGQIIQTVDIKTRGKGKVNVFAADLSSGLYHYTLVADGKVVDSKKMVRE
ncbi:MAG: T9SS type A sorting domain-containing protein [Bacteroidetes bacterium]|nr:T9SS type A sorting domain-containing protein [Bacteroidota bacterium]